MAFLFRSKTSKSMSELAKATMEQLSRFQDSPTSIKTREDAVKTIGQIKVILQGTQEIDANPDQVSQLTNAIIDEDLLYPLSRVIHLLDFNGRKDIQIIFSCILRHKHFNDESPNSADPPAITHILKERPEVIVELCRGYEVKDSAFHCGMVLREALKYEQIAVIILYHEPANDEHWSATTSNDLTNINYDAQQSGRGVFWQFFRWISSSQFQEGVDAFNTFKEILTKHKQLIARYMKANFDLFFSEYHAHLVLAVSYVTKRQGIKLLSELLLERANYDVMMKYVDNRDFLKQSLLIISKDDRKMIQYEMFHVFKVFVANPQKSVAVQAILLNNRAKLLNFLSNFLADREDRDEQFMDERQFLIRTIQNMPSPPVEPVRS